MKLEAAELVDARPHRRLEDQEIKRNLVLDLLISVISCEKDRCQPVNAGSTRELARLADAG
jgi:hypothetical protein